MSEEAYNYLITQLSRSETWTFTKPDIYYMNKDFHKLELHIVNTQISISLNDECIGVIDSNDEIKALLRVIDGE